ncbi:universal stress protein [Roseovarius sp. M141]|uniref:universal stress protein n=1 Tax=Roseovarius sp. M141 TaxID=2583806 RepID=UPI0020CC0F15|nr:universal stress protein [Roseovarius sp. M141]MCQ0094134.1 universal stress protein [Roseovarius sp. M141]
MTTKLVVGLDGHTSGKRALEYAKRLAELIGDCELVVAYIIEWSPFSFQTAEENEARHKRREEETQTALSRVVNPAVESLSGSGMKVRGVVRHGDVSDALIAISTEEQAEQIIVARTSEGGFAKRLFGSSTSNLVMSSPVPVTVVS